MYVFRRGGSFYFEYSDEHRRIRRGGFPTKTLAKLAGEEDRRRRREQRGLVLPPVEQERGLDEAFLEGGHQAKVVDIRSFKSGKSCRAP